MAATDSKHDLLGLDAKALEARVFELQDALAHLRAREDERERAEVALLEAKKELEDSNQAKSEFLARMSHELRTPLNSILGFSQVLNTDPDEPLTQSQKESVRQILKAGWHLLALINEVLDLARIESGKLQLSIESVGVEQIVREALTLIAPVAEKHQVKVVDETKGFRQLYVMADRTRLKQVLLNLLSNGVKYNKAGGTVTLTCTKQGDARLVIAVSDTGAGLSDEERGMLFTPFTRLRARADVEGAGMGLAITKRLIELMGGSVGVESVQGKGSRFFFELRARGEAPRRGGGDGPIAHHRPHGRKRSDAASRRGQPCEPRARLPHPRTPAAYLDPRRRHRGEGARARTNTRSRSHHPGHQPPGDGRLRGAPAAPLPTRIRDTSRSSRLSANAMPSDVKRGLEAGFLQYLTKPIDVKEFLRTIDLFLSGNDLTKSSPPNSIP